jgi:alkanesulfonate monooxygenase SsuD/methylene tetrahydromethanopterin reductase-like flavin-dependent oxidoreductase (luciferase family)
MILGTRGPIGSRSAATARDGVEVVDPFRDVAADVVQAARVRRERFDRRSDDLIVVVSEYAAPTMLAAERSA